MVSTLGRISAGKIDPSPLVLNERVVFTRRIAKVVKGGRNLRFNALVVVGDGEGVVGVGLGKALAIPDAVRKGNATAKKNLIRVPLKGSTIPQETVSKKGASLVLIKPAPPGTGIIAAGVIRAVLDLAGVKDVVAKSLGSRNHINVVYATIEALQQLKDPAEEIARRKGMVAAAAR
jgi:small subunit ribosomal protein S5